MADWLANPYFIDPALSFDVLYRGQMPTYAPSNWRWGPLRIYQVEILLELKYAWGDLFVGAFRLTY
jgi:hypothetical protein